MKGRNGFSTYLSVDKAETRKVVKKKAKKFLAKKKDATITRKDGKFVITKQVDGVDIDFEANADKLTEVFSKKTGIASLLYFQWIIR